jgi:hypothetical protein
MDTIAALISANVMVAFSRPLDENSDWEFDRFRLTVCVLIICVN